MVWERVWGHSLRQGLYRRQSTLFIEGTILFQPIKSTFNSTDGQTEIEISWLMSGALFAPAWFE